MAKYECRLGTTDFADKALVEKTETVEADNPGDAATSFAINCDYFFDIAKRYKDFAAPVAVRDLKSGLTYKVPVRCDFKLALRPLGVFCEGE